MQIEYINRTHKLFDDVKRLGKKNAATLGFMPEGGFDDHAKRGNIIIAHNEGALCGYLMYRVVNRRSRVSIAHLCIDNQHRGQGVTTILLDALREKYQDTYAGISLSCREDYKDASKVWQKYGFVYKTRIRSRSVEEHYLNLWWYDFGRPDLFSAAYESSSTIKALLDANIIVKLRDEDHNHLPSEDPRILLNDWLVDETTFCFAPEMYNEIDRDQDYDRAKKTRAFLENFQEMRFDIEKLKKVAKSLESIILGQTANDKSDRNQLASCIVSGIPYFLTFDRGILSKKEEIEKDYEVQIYTPQEFVLQIDQLLHKDEYSPAFLNGVTTHTLSKMTPEDISASIDIFKSPLESSKQFKDVILKCINDRNTIEIIKGESNEPLAIYASEITDSNLYVNLMRVRECNLRRTIYMQLVSDFTYKGIESGADCIKYNDSYVPDDFKEILGRIGYIPLKAMWIKYIYNDIVDTASVSALLLSKGIEFTPQITKDLLDIEHYMFPLKITDLDIPCYIIPIKPYWASQLFDYKMASESLFGANPDKLWNIENVYFRKTKPITELAPARILWYASECKSHSRSKAIIATSYLDEVKTGRPKELFVDNKHYGIYDWKNIFDLCEGDVHKEIRLLRFSRTEVFEQPIQWGELKGILNNNSPIQSPRKIKTQMFKKLYKIGKWGK